MCSLSGVIALCSGKCFVPLAVRIVASCPTDYVSQRDVVWLRNYSHIVAPVLIVHVDEKFAAIFSSLASVMQDVFVCLIYIEDTERKFIPLLFFRVQRIADYITLRNQLLVILELIAVIEIAEFGENAIAAQIGSDNDCIKVTVKTVCKCKNAFFGVRNNPITEVLNAILVAIVRISGDVKAISDKPVIDTTFFGVTSRHLKIHCATVYQMKCSANAAVADCFFASLGTSPAGTLEY